MNCVGAEGLSMVAQLLGELLVCSLDKTSSADSNTSRHSHPNTQHCRSPPPKKTECFGACNTVDYSAKEGR